MVSTAHGRLSLRERTLLSRSERRPWRTFPNLRCYSPVFGHRRHPAIPPVGQPDQLLEPDVPLPQLGGRDGPPGLRHEASEDFSFAVTDLTTMSFVA